MQPADYQRFRAVMTGLGKLYSTEVDRPLLDAYWLALGSWTLADFEAAAGQLMRTSQYFPRPAAFEELRRAARRTAGEAWAAARECIRHGGTTGDALTERVVEVLGGYRALGLLPSDQMPFIEHRFAEHYAQLQDAEDVREALPQIAGPSRLAIGAPRPARDLLPNPESP